jgi:serine/threonine protein kinase
MSHNFNAEIQNLPLVPDSIVQGRYRIVRQLGRGGMGAVYEAEDQRLGITVALKETLSSEESMRRQFEREARLLAHMQHAALPRVSDHFVDGSRAFLVMQFIGGVDLAKIIAQQPGPFPRDQVVAWAEQLLDALIYLHASEPQVIHRDIKPHNLKLTANGRIALLDFGLAKATPSDPSLTASKAFYGYTRHYAPLEQIQDQRTDPRSDIYALGATLYHLATGIKPPDAMVRAASVVDGGPDPLRRADLVHKAVTPEFAAILNKALAQKPEGRFESATEFRDAVMGMRREASPVTSDKTNATPQTISSESVTTNNSRRRARVPADVNLVLVGSARTFGPAGATAVLALMVALTAGIIYGSQRWFPEVEKIVPPTAVEAALGTREFSMRKGRAAESVTPSLGRAKQNLAGNSRAPEKTAYTVLRNTPSEKRVEPVKTQINSRRTTEPDSVLRRVLKGVGAPSIRLPHPEVTPPVEPYSETRRRATGQTSMQRSPVRLSSSDTKHTSNAIAAVAQQPPQRLAGHSVLFQRSSAAAQQALRNLAGHSVLLQRASALCRSGYRREATCVW